MPKQTNNYDELGQLVRIDDSGTDCTYGYRYNDDGIRLTKWVRNGSIVARA